jgi:hypothetical protein
MKPLAKDCLLALAYITYVVRDCWSCPKENLGMNRYNPNKYRDIDDEDDRNMEVGFNKIQAEERRRSFT